MKIPYVDLRKANWPYRDLIINSVSDHLDSGSFVLSDSVLAFEKALADYINAKYIVTVNSGTSALYLVLKCLGIGVGDEVITVPNSYIATTTAICLLGAKPVFCDVGADGNIDSSRVEHLINSRTKACLPVHLAGIPCDIATLRNLCADKGIKMIEDAAQALGSAHGERRIGSDSLACAFSLHPLKNLGLIGDGGFISTNSDKLYQELLLQRNIGHKDRDTVIRWGHNMRLDGISCSIGIAKLKRLDEVVNSRNKLANNYLEHLPAAAEKPFVSQKNTNSWHTFVINTDYRDLLQKYLAEYGIDTRIHYRSLIYEQEAFTKSWGTIQRCTEAERRKNRILSLPIGEYLKEEEQTYIINCIKSFYKNLSRIKRAEKV